MVSVEATAPPIVIELHEDDVLILGWLGPVKFASPMIALAVEVGTPAVQLFLLSHLESMVPFQLVWPNDGKANKNT